ncbi:MAG: hypothetical protein ACYC6G_00290 [Desulfobaccales bacterium]
MGKRTASLLFIMLVGVIGISLIGCAGAPIATAPAKTMPKMLQDAGFKAHPADTPQKMAHLQTCPRDTLMVQERPGTKCYAFSDPASKTMHVGDEAAYRRLQGLLQKQEQKIREERIESDPQFWPLWVDSQGGG